MTQQFYILSYPGAGTCFIASLLNNYLFNEKIQISEDGDCHNFGFGDFIDTDKLAVVAWKWDYDQVKDPYTIYVGHYNNLKKVKQTNPEIKIIYIQAKKNNYKNISLLRFNKIFKYSKIEKEYNRLKIKFSRVNWPHLSEIIDNPDSVKKEMSKFDSKWHNEWQKELDTNFVDYTLKWEDIFYQKSLVLNSKIANILSVDPNKKALDYIELYQEKNFQLYREFLK